MPALFFSILLLPTNFIGPTLTVPRLRKISPQGDPASTKTDYDYIIPVVDPSSLDLRCGRNASIAWSKPKVAVIRAGDTVGFAVNTTVGLPIPNAPIMPWDVRLLLPLHPIFMLIRPNLTLCSAGQICTTLVLQRLGSPRLQARWMTTQETGSGSRF